MAASEQDGMEQSEMDHGGTGESADLMEALSGGDDMGFVTAEERRPVNRTSMLLFGVLLVGAAGYFLMYARSGPATAGAAVSGEVAQADQTIKQFLSAGEDNIRMMKQLRQTTDGVIAQFKNTSVAQVPVADLHTNPFKFSQITDDAAAAAKKREEERQAVLAEVRQLRLQSILHGARATCMINNQMYRQGETAGSFSIEEITADAVIVRSGDYRFKLQMQR